MSDSLIVGLGNPGSEYEGTRHNTGFAVMDELAARWKKRFGPGRGEFLWLHARMGGTYASLVKPLAYMNNSGRAVSDVLAFSEYAVRNMLVVVDDVALPLGVVRIRPGGSDGGHNGLGSIIAELGTEDFARLRCGIGRPGGEAQGLSSFVLSPFDKTEEEQVNVMIGRAADAVETYIIHGIDKAMSVFNTSP